MSDVTRLLEAANRGDRQAAAALLFLGHDELRNLATAWLAQEAPGHTPEPTNLGRSGSSHPGKTVPALRTP